MIYPRPLIIPGFYVTSREMLHAALAARSQSEHDQTTIGRRRTREPQSYWLGYLAAMADATGHPANDLGALLDRYATEIASR